MLERLQIANRVVPDADLMNTARDLALKLAHGPSVAIELTKRLVYAGYYNSLPVHLAYEMYCSWSTTGTEDFEEGKKSYIEKRKADFKGY